MTPEVLLRLTLLRFEKGHRNTYATESPERAPPLATPGYASSDEFRDIFLSLWAERLSQHISFDAALRSSLLFLLPSQWSGAACDSYYLRDDTNEQVDLQYVKDHCATQYLFSYSPSNGSSFFYLLQQLIVLLRPKLPQLAPTLKDWLAALDTALLSLRTVFIAVQGAFLNSFYEADKHLSSSHCSITWEETRQTYCSSVRKLCCLLDTQLVAVVAQTIAIQLSCAGGCLKTRLFYNVDAKVPEAVANAAASVAAKRLDNIAAHAAANTSFGSAYPEEAKHLQLRSEFVDDNIQRVRQATQMYVEKLAAATAGETELSGSIAKKSAKQKQRTLELEGDKPPLVEIMDEVPPVAFEDACALIAPPISETLALRVAAVAPADDDTLRMVQQLLSDQHSEQRIGCGNTSQRPPALQASPKAKALSPKAQPHIPMVPKKLSAASDAVPMLHTTTSPQKLRSTHKETWLFWTRLQQKLGLEDVAIQRVSERCKFDDESPYPDVFLIDLDPRSNDRATVQFVEKLQKLVPDDPSAAMSAQDTKRFKQICTEYAKELTDKTKELQSALPFLPARVNGVLLGSLYAVLRADKQFQSLKQIYQQASQLGSGAAQKNNDAALLTNVETLLLKRAQFLAKSAGSNEAATEGSLEANASPSDSKHRSSLGAASEKGHLPGADNIDVEKKLLTPNALMQYAKRHSNTLATSAQAEGDSGAIKRRPSVVQAFTEAQRSIKHDTMPLPSPDTRIEEVYRLACRFYGVAANSVLMRRLRHTKENYITSLDLSSNYVGVKGIRPVLSLLTFNGNHLISFSACNNNLENEEVEEVCRVLSGDAGANLVRLDLSFNPISASATNCLQKLCKELPALEAIQLKATLLSPAVVQGLQQAVAAKTFQRHY